ncbi:MAG: hypothetical protein FWG97_01975 [Deltaproteobacteria bacterium]|nr:hypothetical protein [Deltaproteobacteria bacterium]
MPDLVYTLIRKHRSVILGNTGQSALGKLLIIRERRFQDYPDIGELFVELPVYFLENGAEYPAVRVGHSDVNGFSRIGKSRARQERENQSQGKYLSARAQKQIH